MLWRLVAVFIFLFCLSGCGGIGGSAGGGSSAANPYGAGTASIIHSYAKTGHSGLGFEPQSQGQKSVATAKRRRKDCPWIEGEEPDEDLGLDAEDNNLDGLADSGWAKFARLHPQYARSQGIR